MSNNKTLILTASLLLPVFIASGTLDAALPVNGPHDSLEIFVDNQTTGSVDSRGNCPGEYDPVNRSCGDGHDVSFKTMMDAAKYANAGDTIQIRKGIHTAVDVLFPAGGAPGRPLIVQSYPPDGERAIVQRSPDGMSSRSILILKESGAGNYIIRNFVLRNANNGIEISPDTGKIYDVRIENMEIYNQSKSAIRVALYGAERLLILNCLLHDTGGTEAAVDLKVNTNDYAPGAGSRNVIFRNNISYNNNHQQASGFIAQESAENIIYINNLTYKNGEIGFASKAGGYNLFINNAAFDQSKSGYYLRGPRKTFFGDNNTIIGEIRGPISKYILINNTAVTRKIMSGDQGAVRLWDTASAWMYNNTFISMESDPKYWSGPSASIADSEEPTVGYWKNNIFYRVTTGWIMLLGITQRWIGGDGNLFRSEDLKILARVLGGPQFPTLSDYQTQFGSDANSKVSEITFIGLDPAKETQPQDLRLPPGSPAENAGVPYGTSDPNDYPVKIEEWLSAYNQFNDFTLLSAAEKGELLSYIRNAHTIDHSGFPRSGRPDIGAYEHGATAPPSLLIAAFVADKSGGPAPLEVSFDASASGPVDQIANYTWDFNDGSPPVTGKTVSHTYTQEGQFIARLTVTDAQARTAGTWMRIIVGNNATDVDLGENSGAIGFASFKNVINPARKESMEIEFNLEEANTVSLAIYDRSGGEIRRLADMHLEKGFHRVEWDGHNDKGEAIASGVYHLILKSGEKIYKKKIAVLK